LKDILTTINFSFIAITLLFSARAEANEIYSGQLNRIINDNVFVASVDVTVCANLPSGESDGVVVRVLHVSPATGWSDKGSFSWDVYQSGCSTRSGAYWPFPQGTIHVSATLSSGGPSFFLGSYTIY
jgi:hypothetical protein